MLREEQAGGGMDDIGLVDHHCHGVTTTDLDRPTFESLISESFDPPPPGTSHFDAPLGLAIRRGRRLADAAALRSLTRARTSSIRTTSRTPR